MTLVTHNYLGYKNEYISTYNAASPLCMTWNEVCALRSMIRGYHSAQFVHEHSCAAPCIRMIQHHQGSKLVRAGFVA